MPKVLNYNYELTWKMKFNRQTTHHYIHLTSTPKPKQKRNHKYAPSRTLCLLRELLEKYLIYVTYLKFPLCRVEWLKNC